MKRDGARVRRQIQESRESRRTNRHLPSLETDIDSSQDAPSETMSINANNAATSAFPSFLDNNARGPPTQQVNGNGGPMNGMNLSMPMNAGHQMDVNMLYQKVLELSEVLKENREQTQAIVAGAEELAVSNPSTTSCVLAGSVAVLIDSFFRPGPLPMEEVRHYRKPMRRSRVISTFISKHPVD